MLSGVGCQGERLFRFLCFVQTFLLAGTVCFYFQGSVVEAAPGHDIAGDTSQPRGETLRPVWGPMDKCYPGATQRRRVRVRVRSGKQDTAGAGTPKALGGLSGAAPEEEPGVRSQDAGEVRPAAEEAASPVPAGKEAAEEKEVAGTLGCEVRKPGASAGRAPGHSGWGPAGGRGEGWGPPDDARPPSSGVSDPVSSAPGPLGPFSFPGEMEQACPPPPSPRDPAEVAQSPAPLRPSRQGGEVQAAGCRPS